MHCVIPVFIPQGIGKSNDSIGHKARIVGQLLQLRQDFVLLKKLSDEKDIERYQLEGEISKIQETNMELMSKIDDMSIKMEILNRDMASLQKQLNILKRNKIMSKRGNT